EDQERIVNAILAHLEEGGKLGSFALFTHKSWSKFIEQAAVNNARPRIAEHFHALRRLLRLQGLREDLRARWDRQVAVLGAPRSSEMGDEVEQTFMQFWVIIEHWL